MKADDRVAVERLRSRLAQLDQDAQAIRRAIAVLQGDASSPAAGRSKRRVRSGSTTAKVQKIVLDNPDRIWDAEGVLEALTTAGDAPTAKDPVNAIRTALARLAKRDEIERVGTGEYRAPTPGRSPEPDKGEPNADDDAWDTGNAEEPPEPAGGGPLQAITS